MEGKISIVNSRNLKWSLLGIVVLTCLSIAVLSSCYKKVNKPVFLNHAEDTKYVGSDKCAECHADKLETFQHTGMGLSFERATRKKSKADFSRGHIIKDSTTGLSYQPYWVGDSLFVHEFLLSGLDTIHSLKVKVDYIVGSGQHTNSHIASKNGYLYQVPITFYVQDGKWDLAPGFENGNNARFNRILNNECISCHNSMPEMVDQSEFKFSSVGNGIDCERCHGPGEIHVKKIELGEDNTGKDDWSIVNPSKLSWELQVDLCQRCHLQGLNQLKPGKTFLDFRPGMELSSVFDIYLPQYKGNNEAFDMANHSARFQMSKCFVNGNKKNLDFTCISCHNPHISVEMTGKGVYNASCKQCHKKESDCLENLDSRLTIEDNCVQCHMPVSGSVDIAHVTVHDHYIRKPLKETDKNEIKELIGLYAVNNPSPTLYEQTRAYLEYWEKFDKNPLYLEKAYKLLQKGTNNNLWLKYYYLNGDYDKACNLKLAESDLTAWELFILGECYAKIERPREALYYATNAFRIDATNPQIAEQVGRFYINAGKLMEAYEITTSVLSEFPNSGVVLNQKAKVLLLLKRNSEAKSLLERALSLEPLNKEVWKSHINYYKQIGDKAKLKYWQDRYEIKFGAL